MIDPLTVEVTLVCDVMACPARLNTKQRRMELAVEYGRLKGWQCSDVGDLCDLHADAPKAPA